MRIQINTSSHRVNRYSDFTLTFSLTKNGDPYVPQSFIMVFYVDTWDDCCGRYTASCIDGVYNNCSVSGTTITVYFDSPTFNLAHSNAGSLTWWMIPHSAMARSTPAPLSRYLLR